MLVSRLSFFSKLHTFTALSYTGVLLVLVLVALHPLYLGAVLGAVFMAVWAAGGLKIWGSYLRVVFPLVLLLLVINLLVNRAGETVFWRFSSLPFVGWLDFAFTLEAFCYGVAMGVRLVAVSGVFCLYNLIVHPDRLLRFLGRLAWKSALVASLAIRLFPSLLSSASSIREALELRGVNFAAGSAWERARKYSLILRVLLFSSLEESLQLAEAMQARAFGGGQRSFYSQEEFRPGDWFVLGGCLFSLAAALAGSFFKWDSFRYYPRLGELSLSGLQTVHLLAVLAGILIPVALNWGWQKWSFLRSKI